MNNLQLQFEAMLQRGTIPVLEYELYTGDYLTVEIESTETGLQFSADFSEGPCFFDGQITGAGNYWFLPWDDCFSLDEHLQMIGQNVMDGYIIAHSLDVFSM